MKPVTEKQKECLILLSDGPLGTGTISQKINSTIDTAHSRMRRLEDKLMVRRIQMGLQGSIEWELTRLGRKEI